MKENLGTDGMCDHLLPPNSSHPATRDYLPASPITHIHLSVHSLKPPLTESSTGCPGISLSEYCIKNRTPDMWTLHLPLRCYHPEPILELNKLVLFPGISFFSLTWLWPKSAGSPEWFGFRYGSIFSDNYFRSVSKLSPRNCLSKWGSMQNSLWHIVFCSSAFICLKSVFWNFMNNKFVYINATKDVKQIPKA